MTLLEYLKTTTQAEFAARLGVTQSAVSQWLTGESRITAERAKEIEIATNSAVTRAELLPELFGDMTKKRKAAA